MPSARAETTYAYVNSERTHEVLAVAAEEASRRLKWTLTERPTGSRDPADWVVEESFESPARLPELVRDLEARLAATGAYWRLTAADAPPEPLPPPPRLDLSGHAVPIPGQAEDAFLEYFHFHSRSVSRVILALPRAVIAPRERADPRFVLAGFDFPTSAPRAGALSIVHSRLAPELVVSRVAGEHLVLPRRGLRKLHEPQEYRDALGAEWQERASRVLAYAAELLFRGRTKSPVADTLPPKARETELEAALRSRAYLAARAELLDPADDPERLLDGGELEIRRALRVARKRASPRDQARLSLVEAGLLVELGLRAGRERLVQEYAAQAVRLAKSFHE